MNPIEPDNIQHATSAADVDALNSAFYGRIRYPWPPQAFHRLEDAHLWSHMLGQDIGCWHEPVVPALGGKVWVAGCGTNQALLTALKFPAAAVQGSDLSAESLDLCRRNAEQVGAANLTLVRESLNTVTYRDAFDYAVCTGVIHHNADPAIPLRRIAAALKPEGILELMVYNVYHRTHTAAVQLAVQTMAGTRGGDPNFDRELALAKELVREPSAWAGDARVASFLEEYRDTEDAHFADSLLQPVERSYTVASLERLAADCGLEILGFAVDQFSRSRGGITYNLELPSEALREAYGRLGDVERWHVTNLLLAERSPMLWFYFQRRDSKRARKTEDDIAASFLETTFEPVATTQRTFSRSGDGTRYVEAEGSRPFPRPTDDPAARRVIDAVAASPGRPMGQVLTDLGLPTEPRSVHSLRVRVATSAFPFLRAVPPSFDLVI